MNYRSAPARQDGAGQLLSCADIPCLDGRVPPVFAVPSLPDVQSHRFCLVFATSGTMQLPGLSRVSHFFGAAMSVRGDPIPVEHACRLWRFWGLSLAHMHFAGPCSSAYLGVYLDALAEDQAPDCLLFSPSSRSAGQVRGSARQFGAADGLTGTVVDLNPLLRRTVSRVVRRSPDNSENGKEVFSRPVRNPGGRKPCYPPLILEPLGFWSTLAPGGPFAGCRALAALFAGESPRRPFESKFVEQNIALRGPPVPRGMFSVRQLNAGWLCQRPALTHLIFLDSLPGQTVTFGQAFLSGKRSSPFSLSCCYEFSPELTNPLISCLKDSFFSPPFPEISPPVAPFSSSVFWGGSVAPRPNLSRSRLMDLPPDLSPNSPHFVAAAPLLSLSRLHFLLACAQPCDLAAFFVRPPWRSWCRLPSAASLRDGSQCVLAARPLILWRHTTLGYFSPKLVVCFTFALEPKESFPPATAVVRTIPPPHFICPVSPRCSKAPPVFGHFKGVAYESFAEKTRDAVLTITVKRPE